MIDVPFFGKRAYAYYIIKPCKKGSVVYVLERPFHPRRLEVYADEGCIVRSTVKQPEEGLEAAIKRLGVQQYP